MQFRINDAFLEPLDHLPFKPQPTLEARNSDLHAVPILCQYSRINQSTPSKSEGNTEKSKRSKLDTTSHSAARYYDPLRLQSLERPPCRFETT